ncbi:MAG: hypothetical protein AB1592_07020 [Pseudomonadota bacterium]
MSRAIDRAQFQLIALAEQQGAETSRREERLPVGKSAPIQKGFVDMNDLAPLLHGQADRQTIEQICLKRG